MAFGAVQRNFRAAAEGQAEGRDDDRPRAELDGLRHLLEGADVHLDLVPLFVLRGEQKLHEICAGGEVRGVVGDDEAAEVTDSVAVGAQILTHEVHDVAAEGIHLGVKLDACDAVADVDE